MRRDDPRKAGGERRNDLQGLIDGERRLRHVSDLAGSGFGHGDDVGLLLDDKGAISVGIVVIAQNSLNLDVIAMSDHRDRSPLPGMPGDFEMHLGHERTGSVENAEPEGLGLCVNLRRRPVGAQDDTGSGGNFREFFDEYSAATAEAFDHHIIVNDGVTDENRPVVTVERPLDDRDGSIDPSAKSARIGQHQLHSSSGQKKFASGT